MKNCEQMSSKIAHSPFKAEKKNLDLTKVPNLSGAF